MFKSNKQSYFGHRTEHKFDEKREIEEKNKKNITKIRKFISKSKPEQRDKYIEGLLNDCINKENELSDEKIKNAKYRKRESRVIVIGISILITFFVAFVLEYPLSHFRAGYKTIVVGLFGEVSSILIELLLCKKNEKKGGCEGIIGLCKIFIKKFPQKASLHFVMLFMLVLTLSGVFANVNLIHRSIAFGKMGYLAFQNYDKMDNLDMSVGEGVVYEEELLAILNTTQIEQLDEEMLRVMSQKDGELRLSQEDWNLVFFCGEYSIKGLEDQWQIDNIVWAMVEELDSHDLENVFDKPFDQGGAPQIVRNQISNLSDNEKYAKSFEEVNEILDYREYIKKIYPKKSLAQLVANGYEYLGNICYKNNNNTTTIIYHYGQSIINNLECLEFAENSDKTIKEKLTDIVRIYKSIAFTCRNREEAIISIKLAVAFQHAADQY